MVVNWETDPLEDLFQNIILDAEGRIGVEAEKPFPAVPPAALRPRAGIWRARLRAALVAAALAVLLLCILAVAHPDDFANWLETTQEQFERLDSRPPEEVLKTWSRCYLPAEVPDGYGMSYATGGEDCKAIEYTDEAARRIVFYQYSGNAAVHFDVGDKHLCTVGDWEGTITDSGKTSCLRWNDGVHLFSIEFPTGGVSATEVVRMAESLTYIP